MLKIELDHWRSDSITHNSVVSDSSLVVSVADEKVDGVAVIEITSNRRRKPYGTS